MIQDKHEVQIKRATKMNYRTSILFMIFGLAVFATSVLFQFFTMNAIVTSGIVIAVYLIYPASFLLWGSMVFAFGWTRFGKPSTILVRILAVVGLIILFLIIIIFDSLLRFFSKVLIPYYLLIDAMTPLLVTISTIFYSRRFYGKSQTEYYE